MSLVRLKDACEIGSGFAFKSDEFLSTGVPLLRISNIENEKVNFGKGTVYLNELYLEKFQKFIVRQGDIIIALSGATTGKYGIYDLDEPCLLNQRIGIIRNNLSKKLDSQYLYNYLSKLKSEIYRKAQGAAQPNISTKELGDLQIPLPSLAEQRQIAAILDAADSLRQKDQQVVEHYEQLSQSLFLEMFGDPVTNPKGWGKVKFGELVKIERGGSPRPINDYLGGAYPWIKIGDATKGNEIYIDKTKENIIEAGLKKTRLLPSGSIIFANCGVSLGFARIITFEGCIHDGWLSFSEINDKQLNKIFILKALNSITQHFRNTAPDGTQPNLNTSIMKSFEFILPPIQLQNQFAECIAEIERQKQQAQANLAKSNDLFNALLQKAFTGELTANQAA